MTPIIKIALVDDESLFLEGLALLLNSNPNIQIVLSSTDSNSFLYQLDNCVKETFPDIAFLDIQMQPIDGFQLVEIIKLRFPNLKIIILSSHYKSAMLGHMIKLGISAFLPKNASLQLLFQAVLAVYEIGVFFTLDDHQLLSAYLNNKPKNTYSHSKHQLSKRETEILKLICQEFTNQEIADKLFISKRTVESHRQHLLEKVGTKSTVGLVVYAVCNQIHFPDFNLFQ